MGLTCAHLRIWTCLLSGPSGVYVGKHTVCGLITGPLGVEATFKLCRKQQWPWGRTLRKCLEVSLLVDGGRHWQLRCRQLPHLPTPKTFFPRHSGAPQAAAQPWQTESTDLMTASSSPDTRGGRHQPQVARLLPLLHGGA